MVKTSPFARIRQADGRTDAQTHVQGSGPLASAKCSCGLVVKVVGGREGRSKEKQEILKR